MSKRSTLFRRKMDLIAPLITFYFLSLFSHTSKMRKEQKGTNLSECDPFSRISDLKTYRSGDVVLKTISDNLFSLMNL